MKKLILILAAFSLLVPAYAQGRGGGQSVKQKVKVGKVFETQNIETRRVVGFVTTVSRVEITTRISADLEKVGFKDGDHVEKGQMLYQFDDVRYAAAVKNAEAKLAEVKARLIYAEKNYDRTNELYKKDAASKDAMETTLSTLAACRAELLAAEANLVTAQDDLKHTRIYAPISGRIGKSAFTEGNLITPQGGKLTDIEMISPIHVRFSLSERVFRRDFGGMEGIRKQAVIRLELADGTLYEENARVSLVDNKINATTNTITVWAAFQNLDQQLIPGGFVTVLASAKAEKEFLAVLPSALIAEEDGYCVYALDSDNRVVRKPVKTGGTAPGGLQIILEGLENSERIIVDGTHKATPGERVTPVAPTAQ